MLFKLDFLANDLSCHHIFPWMDVIHSLPTLLVITFHRVFPERRMVRQDKRCVIKIINMTMPRKRQHRAIRRDKWFSSYFHLMRTINYLLNFHIRDCLWGWVFVCLKGNVKYGGYVGGFAYSSDRIKDLHAVCKVSRLRVVYAFVTNTFSKFISERLKSFTSMR